MKGSFKKETGKKHKVVKSKQPCADMRDFLLVKDRFYYVATASDRSKLSQYESVSRPPQKDTPLKHRPVGSGSSHESLREFVSPTAIPAKKTLEERIRSLTYGRRQVVIQELQKDAQSTEASTCMELLELDIEDTHLSVELAHGRCMELLEQSRGRVSKTEYADKEGIIRRIKDRKVRVLDNIRNLFRQVILKERGLTEGELNLEQVFLSAELITGSTERIADQEELRQDKLKLIRHLQNKLQLKLDLGVPPVVGELADSSARKVDASPRGSPVKAERTSPKKQEDALDLVCEEKRPSMPMVIPTIMTRDKREQIEKERSAQQQKVAQAEIERRLQQQLGHVDSEPSAGLVTSLVGMSRYLDSLINFIRWHYLDDVLELINMPYGKSVDETLISLREKPAEAVFDQTQFILSDKLFIEVEREIVGSAKQSDPQYQLKECEHIHNRAMFDCMNHALNIYRPYYQSNGEVYPWLTTEKGMTFYSISEQNIQEVFEKCKVKILETAAFFCGLLPSEDLNAITNPIYTTKREELLTRALASEVADEGEQWVFREEEQARLQLRLSESLLDSLIREFVEEW